MISIPKYGVRTTESTVSQRVNTRGRDSPSAKGPGIPLRRKQRRNQKPMKTHNEINGATTPNKKRSVAAMGLPDVANKVMARSYQRSGVVAGGTLLSSGARQATVTFTPPTFRKLKLAADKNGVSLSEMVRQAVEAYLNG